MEQPSANGNGYRGQSIRDILIAFGLVTADRWDDAARVDESNPAQVLIDRGVLRPAQLARARAARLGLEFRDLKVSPNPELGAVLPPALRASGRCAVLEVQDDRVVVAVGDPAPDLWDRITAAVRPRRLEIVVVPPEVLPPPVEMDDVSDTAMERPVRVQESEDPDDQPFLVRRLASIVEGGIAARASDIYIGDYGADGCGYKYKIYGIGTPISPIEPRYLQRLINQIKIRAHLDIAEHQNALSGEIRWVSRARVRYDLRVEIGPGARGPYATIRIFGHIAQTRLEDLGLTDDLRDRLDYLCGLSYGLVLVCGKTGSGKSTTLSVMLRRIHERYPGKQIFTVENPPEQDLAGIQQVAVNEDAGRTFAHMLRSFLRSAPDVIMVGEIRDKETATVAIDAALTGHLVFSTLHTNTAPGVVPRLVHMGVEPYLIGATLQAAMSQRLVRRVCPHCRREEKYEGPERVAARRYGLPATEWRGLGCDRCQSGYSGQLAIAELMPLSTENQNKITADTSEQELREWTKLTTMYQNGLVHVREGRTTLAEVLEATRMLGSDDVSSSE